MAATEPLTPEHDKLSAISDKSQAIYDFLEWLAERDVYLDSSRTFKDETVHSFSIMPDSMYVKERLAEFFEIDLDKIEAEKRAMLDYLRALNDG